MKVIPTDVYNKTGELLKIEFHNLEGEFQLQANWDDNDKQTSENREAFRKWAYNMAKNLKFEVSV